MDLEDQSVTRTDAQYRALFEQAGLELIATELQKKYDTTRHRTALHCTDRCVAAGLGWG